MISLRDVQKLSPRDRRKLLTMRGLSTRDRQIIAELVAKADEPLNDRDRKIFADAKAWDAARAATVTYGHQGRDDIPTAISAEDDRFYLSIRPCRPLRPGETWTGSLLHSRLFAGAAQRFHRDQLDGMPIREIVGRCDKAKLTGFHRSPYPWLVFAIRDFRIPQVRNASWEGDPTTECTDALRTALAPNYHPVDVNPLIYDDACDKW